MLLDKLFQPKKKCGIKIVTPVFINPGGTGALWPTVITLVYLLAEGNWLSKQTTTTATKPTGLSKFLSDHNLTCQREFPMGQKWHWAATCVYQFPSLCNQQILINAPKEELSYQMRRSKKSKDSIPQTYNIELNNAGKAQCEYLITVS